VLSPARQRERVLWRAERRARLQAKRDARRGEGGRR
jgi:hypothetical protein